MNVDGITQTQNFAIEMLGRALGVSTYCRTMEEAISTGSLFPRSVKLAHYLINEELRKYSQTEEFKARQFTRFKAGDTIVRYEFYPTRISPETVRQALTNFGFREPRRKAA